MVVLTITDVPIASPIAQPLMAVATTVIALIIAMTMMMSLALMMAVMAEEGGFVATLTPLVAMAHRSRIAHVRGDTSRTSAGTLTLLRRPRPAQVLPRAQLDACIGDRGALPSLSFDAVMSQTAARAELLRHLLRAGCVLVDSTPPSLDATAQLAYRIAGRIRRTFFGGEHGGVWHFTADMAHGDLAYSSAALRAHTDGTYFADPPRCVFWRFCRCRCALDVAAAVVAVVVAIAMVMLVEVAAHRRTAAFPAIRGRAYALSFATELLLLPPMRRLSSVDVDTAQYSGAPRVRPFRGAQRRAVQDDGW